MSNQSNHRSNTKVRTLALSLLTGATLFSCQLDEMEIPQEELYLREFIKEYGVFDKSQDWNLAKRESVTVKVGSTSRVKVYAYWEGKRYIFADYENVSGTQTLGFDLPKGIDDIIVKVNGVQKNAKVGDTVDFTGNSGSRTTHTENSTDVVKISNTDYKILSLSEINDYATLLPEGLNNEGKFTQNFIYISNGPFTIYPVLWVTNHMHNLGVYYYNDNEEIVEVSVYTTKSGNELQGTQVNGPSYTLRGGDDDDWLLTDELKAITDFSYTDEQIKQIEELFAKKYNSDVAIYNKDTHALQAYNWYDCGGTTVLNESSPLYRSKGITIDLPIGTRFGLYTSYTHGRIYSEQHLNTGHHEEWDKKVSDSPMPYVVTMNRTDATTGEDYLMIGFEDWPHGSPGADHDYNDMVFRMYGALPTIEDEDADEAYTWILAVEDLGNTDDFDFNDIVVSVKHVSGRSNALVTALAAGGTLPIYLFFDGKPIHGTGENGDEYHSWFDDGTIPSSTMINTGAGPTATGKQYEITVETDWSLAPDKTTVDETYNNMGGFSVKVERPDGTTTELKAPTGSDGNIAAPQMICVPGTWKWPKERTGIHEAYTGFNAWCKDKETNKNWYNSPVSGTVFGE